MLPYINIFGKIIPMYGVCFITGILIASLFMVKDCKKKGMLWENAAIIGVMGLSIGLVGAKILYIFVTFSPSELILVIKSGHLDSIVTGGFVFYGGLIGGILGAFLGTFIAKCTLKEYENVLVKLIPFCHAFGRLGCFCAGCCFGKHTNSPIHVVFTNPNSYAPLGEPLIPIQLYEAFFNFVLFGILSFIDIKYPKNRLILPIYILSYALERFIMENFRADAVRGFLFGLSTSQWISIILSVIGIILLIIRLKKSGKIYLKS